MLVKNSKYHYSWIGGWTKGQLSGSFSPEFSAIVYWTRREVSLPVVDRWAPEPRLIIADRHLCIPLKTDLTLRRQKIRQPMTIASGKFLWNL